MGETLKYSPEEKKGIKTRELKELTEDERAQYEEAENVLNISRSEKYWDAGAVEKIESKTYIEAIETIKNLQVREGREILFRCGLNDKNRNVQIKTAETLGEIGLLQDIKAMKLRFTQLSPRDQEDDMLGLGKAIEKIEKRSEVEK